MIWWGNLWEIDPLEDPREDVRILLKWHFGEMGYCMDRNDLAQGKTGGGLLSMR